MGHHQEAIADCDQAIALDPRLAAALDHRGSSYAALGQPERAVDDFTSALDLDSSVPIVFLDRAAAYLSLGKLAAARADLDSFIAAAASPMSPTNNFRPASHLPIQ